MEKPAIKYVNVAAAVIQRADGHILLGQRAPDTFYPGYWEFPGGKVEAGETPAGALVRELEEELGIQVNAYTPWIVRQHHYEHAHVTLHFFRVTAWEGELRDHVHSALAWQHPDHFTVNPMLPANAPVLKSLQLPELMCVSQAQQIGIDAGLEQLQRALQRGIRFFQIRESGLSDADYAEFLERALALPGMAQALVVVNEDPRQLRLPIRAYQGVKGIQLTARLCSEFAQRSASPEQRVLPAEFAFLGASCHSAQELHNAAAIGCDYAVMGSVKATASHPDHTPLGWPAFAALAAGSTIPVLAIGGLSPQDLCEAQRHHAHGIAGIRGMS